MSALVIKRGRVLEGDTESVLLTCIVSDPLYAELVSLLCELRLFGFE